MRYTVNEALMMANHYGKLLDELKDDFPDWETDECVVELMHNIFLRRNRLLRFVDRESLKAGEKKLSNIIRKCIPKSAKGPRTTAAKKSAPVVSE